MNLLELQRRMSFDVTRPLTADFEMQRETEDGSSVQEMLAAYVKPNDRLSSFERLEIYNRQYWFRVIGAVSEDFPALQSVMGTKMFDSMVLAYLREISAPSSRCGSKGILSSHPGAIVLCSMSHAWSGLTWRPTIVRQPLP
jgi:hypothetical protein